MFIKFKYWVETHFNLVLIFSLILGMFSPWAEGVSDIFIFFILGSMIFFSCARITINDVRHIHPSKAILFYSFRFIVLPFILFGLAMIFIPQYKEAVLLLALMPAGASAGALANICGGNVTIALGYTVISSLLAPFIVTAAFALVGYDGVELDIWSLFYTLCGVVFIPVVVYFTLVRRVVVVKEWVQEETRFYSTILVSVLLVIVIGKQREVILSDPIFLIEVMPLLFIMFFLFYIVGWISPAYGQRTTRISHAISSGAMNNALAIGIALVYFAPEIALFMVLTEIPWVLCLPLFQIFLSRQRGRDV